MTAIIRPNGKEIEDYLTSTYKLEYFTPLRTSLIKQGDLLDVLCDDGLNYIVTVMSYSSSADKGHIHFKKWPKYLDYKGSFKALYLTRAGTFSKLQGINKNNYYDKLKTNLVNVLLSSNETLGSNPSKKSNKVDGSENLLSEPFLKQTATARLVRDSRLDNMSSLNKSNRLRRVSKVRSKVDNQNDLVVTRQRSTGQDRSSNTSTKPDLINVDDVSKENSNVQNIEFEIQGDTVVSTRSRMPKSSRSTSSKSSVITVSASDLAPSVKSVQPNKSENEDFSLNQSIIRSTRSHPAIDLTLTLAPHRRRRRKKLTITPDELTPMLGPQEEENSVMRKSAESKLISHDQSQSAETSVVESLSQSHEPLVKSVEDENLSQPTSTAHQVENFIVSNADVDLTQSRASSPLEGVSVVKSRGKRSRKRPRLFDNMIIDETINTSDGVDLYDDNESNVVVEVGLPKGRKRKRSGKRRINKSNVTSTANQLVTNIELLDSAVSIADNSVTDVRATSSQLVKDSFSSEVDAEVSTSVQLNLVVPTPEHISKRLGKRQLPTDEFGSSATSISVPLTPNTVAKRRKGVKRVRQVASISNMSQDVEPDFGSNNTLDSQNASSLSATTKATKKVYTPLTRRTSAVSTVTTSFQPSAVLSSGESLAQARAALDLKSSHKRTERAIEILTQAVSTSTASVLKQVHDILSIRKSLDTILDELLK